jgi:hypothetical protein
MQALSEPSILALWERGRTLHPLDRGLLTVSAAFPDERQSAPADWSLGRRNRALAQVRRACFGPTLRGWVPCGSCAEQLEFTVDATAFAEEPLPGDDRAVVVDGCSFRLPTTRDLAALLDVPDREESARRLATRCALAAVNDLTNADLGAIGEAMALADPLAEIVLHFDCPACGKSFDESLDLAAFVWTELEAQAKRLLRSVHVLASAYGWSESEILALSEARRDAYVELVQS